MSTMSPTRNAPTKPVTPSARLGSGKQKPNAGSCGSISARHPALARHTRCSARRIDVSNGAPTRRGGGRDPRTEENRGSDQGHRENPAAATSSTAAAGSPNSTSRPCCGRGPQVVLVDELAHTNTPGSKNPKRWQDVEELLDAGITVISTVNVQHLESLNDVVAQITGIEQQERSPTRWCAGRIADGTRRHHARSVAAQAFPRQRLRLGAGRRGAVQLLPPGNLTALRELALLWLADQVDAALGGIPLRGRQDHRYLGGARTGRGRRHRGPESKPWSGALSGSHRSPARS